jgi:hypothetical protein
VQQQDAAQSLWMAYNSCTRNLQASCSSRRAAALQLIPPIIFSKEERKLIPDAVVEDILSLNSLDLELYEHAEMLYAKQKQLFLSLNQPQVPFSSLTSPSNLGVLFMSTAYMLIGLGFEPEDQDEIGT